MSGELVRVVNALKLDITAQAIEERFSLALLSHRALLNFSAFLWRSLKRNASRINRDTLSLNDIQLCTLLDMYLRKL